MEIRNATKEDLFKILALGMEFGHLMLYQKDPEVMKRYLPRILVAEEEIPTGVLYEGEIHEVPPSSRVVVGYYHYIVSGDPGFEEMLRCYRQMDEWLIAEAVQHEEMGVELGICMQGASHREVFRGFIEYLQKDYPEIWCFCSIKSRRVDTYKELAFIFNPEEQYTFFNVSKGDISTYQLGRWKG